MGFNVGARDETLMYWVTKTSYVWGFIISGCFLYFCISYPKDIRPPKALVCALAIILFPLSAVTLLTDWISGDPFLVPGVKNFGWYDGPLWFLFDIPFFGFVCAGLIILFKKLSRATDLLERKHLKIMFWSLLLGFIPPMITDVILPRLGYFALTWIGPVSGIMWVFVVSYAIVRHKQMNVKMVFGQAIIVAMLILFLANIFTDLGFGILGRIANFMVLGLLGLFLLKSILDNQLQKEELMDLTQNLQQKVDAQTKDIQRAYEVEKKAHVDLQQLNQNKNDFIIITQHHLRTPLSQIRWYADSIRNGLYGTVSAELGAAVSRIDTASEKLIKTLNNFLEVVQMKIGTKIFNNGTITLKPIIEKLLDEFSNEIQKRKITVTFPEQDSAWPSIRADAERIKDALAILIDNAIQYNKEKGSIDFESEREGNRFLLRISNTGLGLSREDSARLFKQSFFRTKEARRVNPTGMGVGLLVAKTIIEAHGGEIQCEKVIRGLVSFLVRLPITH